MSTLAQPRYRALFFAACLGLGEVLATVLRSGVGNLLRESLAIGGWVALWRPMEIFLYDWWPIRG